MNEWFVSRSEFRNGFLLPRTIFILNGIIYEFMNQMQAIQFAMSNN